MHGSTKLRPEIASKSVAEHDDGARRRRTRRERTRGTMAVVGNESKRPTPARRDHPSAIPDRSCPAPPRRSPPIVAVPLADQLGAGLIDTIGTHLRRTTRDAPPDRAESSSKVRMARRFPPPSAPTPHYIGPQMSRDKRRQLTTSYTTASEHARCAGPLAYLSRCKTN